MIKRINCIKPFYSLELHTQGRVSFCCPAWSKFGYIGSINNSSLEEIWNGELAQVIRKKVYSNDLTDVCKKEICPHLYNRKFMDIDRNNIITPFLTKLHTEEILKEKTYLTAKPTYITFANWHKCNLECIMCGPWRSIYKSNSNPLLDIKKKKEKIKKGKDAFLANKICKNLEKYFPYLKIIRFTGAGDPLIRDDTKNILLKKDKSSDLGIELATNGLLFTPRLWNSIKHNKFLKIDVSIDAATKSTYEKIRKGGSWERLMSNLNFISNLRRKGEVPSFILNFVVMRSNYREIVKFARLGQQLKCDRILFQKVRGDICNNENIFENKDYNCLNELKKIKRKALELDSEETKVEFINF